MLNHRLESSREFTVDLRWFTDKFCWVGLKKLGEIWQVICLWICRPFRSLYSSGLFIIQVFCFNRHPSGTWATGNNIYIYGKYCYSCIASESAAAKSQNDQTKSPLQWSACHNHCLGHPRCLDITYIWQDFEAPPCCTGWQLHKQSELHWQRTGVPAWCWKVEAQLISCCLCSVLFHVTLPKLRQHLVPNTSVEDMPTVNC